MSDAEIIKLWKSGLNKYQVAELYRKVYNQKIKIIRMDMKHRHALTLTKQEALEHVENVLLEYLKVK